MTSILKVDQLQDSGGNAILTSNGAGSITTASGLNTAITNAGFVTSANAGKVLQVVSNTQTGSISTTSTSFTNVFNATLNVAITPSSASNKIFVVASTGGYGGTGYFTIYRDATNLGDASVGMTGINSFINAPVAMSYLDSPSTTSSVYYQVYQRTDNATYPAITGRNGVKGSITVFEIQG